ncbi:hypothetical protein [Exiguobacterium sp. RIT594]|uniref:hypothetical protein n=1 Tax=unclassified Exiguobacterium TaxID=2644629 RepID=UPI000DF82BCD|nr:hypothetical protein [Exiguobacterium sp. RIT594]RDB34452.1 hypothetical protein DVG79_07195 [Exiguobacterium sp. RIT594]
MRKFNFLLILAVISFLTIGIYTIFIQSIDESDFTVETVKGDPKQPAVRSVQAELYDEGLKKVDYNVALDGRVEKTKDNWISGMFEGPYNENGAPADFRRFIRSDYVLTFEQQGTTYAMGTKDNNKWELQYWEKGKQRVVKKIFPAPPEARKLGETQLSPDKRFGNSLYVLAQDIQNDSETLLYKIDLKNDTIQKINLPVTSKGEIIILGIHNETIVYYTTEIVEGADDEKETLYLSDGKKSQRLTGLKSFGNEETKLSTDGTKLIMLEREPKKLNWTIYDLASKKSIKHKISIPSVTDESGSGEYTELKDDLIYTANRTGDGVFNVLVIDALSERVIYEGNIKDKLKRTETTLNSLVYN